MPWAKVQRRMFLNYFSIRSLAFTILSALAAKSPRPLRLKCFTAEVAECGRQATFEMRLAGAAGFIFCVSLNGHIFP